MTLFWEKKPKNDRDTLKLIKRVVYQKRSASERLAIIRDILFEGKI